METTCVHIKTQRALKLKGTQKIMGPGIPHPRHPATILYVRKLRPTKEINDQYHFFERAPIDTEGAENLQATKRKKNTC